MKIAALLVLLIATVAAVENVRLDSRMLNLQQSYHYEDPFYSTHKPHCTGAQEKIVTYAGLDDYYACMPASFGDFRKKAGQCYQDFPVGTTATPMGIFYDEEGTQRCALVCSGIATGFCPHGAECMIIPGVAQAQVGVCLFKDPKA